MKGKMIGLYFGSFNPVHIGHLAIANYMVEYSALDEVWFVVSPQNPFKSKKSLLEDYHRYGLVVRAIDDYPKFRVSNIEFSMPKPSYTIDTLAYLKDKYPQHQFSLIMGSDNLPTLPRWKNYQQILANHSVFVYPRPGFRESEMENRPEISVVQAPLMEISSSFIRKAIGQGKDIRFFMPQAAYNYLREMHFYEK